MVGDASVLFLGLIPGATYTVAAIGGITFSGSVTMPTEVLGMPGSSSSWSEASWKKGNGDNLQRLPCPLDNIVLLEAVSGAGRKAASRPARWRCDRPRASSLFPPSPFLLERSNYA